MSITDLLLVFSLINLIIIYIYINTRVSNHPMMTYIICIHQVLRNFQSKSENGEAYISLYPCISYVVRGVIDGTCCYQFTHTGLDNIV